MYWPILLQNNFSVSIEFMGLVFVGISLSVYAGSQFSKFWQKKIKCEKYAIFFSQIFTLLGIAGCLLFSKLSLFLVFFFVKYPGNPV